MTADAEFWRRPHQQQCRSNIVECYKTNDSFDKVECCFHIVAVFGNNVKRKFCYFDKVEKNWTCSVCFNFVETRSKLLPFWQQSRMLLRQSGTLLRHCCLLFQHCCWCGRGFSSTVTSLSQWTPASVYNTLAWRRPVCRRQLRVALLKNVAIITRSVCRRRHVALSVWCIIVVQRHFRRHRQQTTTITYHHVRDDPSYLFSYLCPSAGSLRHLSQGLRVAA